MIAETVGVFNRVSLMVAGDVVRFGDVKQRAKMITTHVRLLKARERERGVAVGSENLYLRLPGSRLESVVSVALSPPPLAVPRHVGAVRFARLSRGARGDGWPDVGSGLSSGADVGKGGEQGPRPLRKDQGCSLGPPRPSASPQHHRRHAAGTAGVGGWGGRGG